MIAGSLLWQQVYVVITASYHRSYHVQGRGTDWLCALLQPHGTLIIAQEHAIAGPAGTKSSELVQSRDP